MRRNADRRFHPGRTGEGRRLGELETAVMEEVWRHGGTRTVTDVHEALTDSSAPAYTTVKTTMERLAEKGILRRERSGRAYTYTAAIGKAELERRIVAGALEALVREFPEAVASFLTPDGQRIDPAELERLAAQVKALRGTEDDA
jgi:predicted transcriptional regulator